VIDTRTGTSPTADSFYCHIEACMCIQSFIHNWTRVLILIAAFTRWSNSWEHQCFKGFLWWL